jgi:histone H3/H4
LIKDAGCNTAGDALDGLNNYVYWLVQTAAKRASENGRKTVRSHDFHI